MSEQQQEQADLPLDSFLEGLREDVKALGGSTAVGKWFMPDKSDEAQRNFVNDCLSSGRRARFSESQLELIMRRAVQRRGFSAAHNYLCDAIGMERPRPKDPDAARERAMVRVAEAAERMESAVAELKRLGFPVPLRKVG